MIVYIIIILTDKSIIKLNKRLKIGVNYDVG